MLDFETYFYQKKLLLLYIFRILRLISFDKIEVLNLILLIIIILLKNELK